MSENTVTFISGEEALGKGLPDLHPYHGKNTVYEYYLCDQDDVFNRKNCRYDFIDPEDDKPAWYVMHPEDPCVTGVKGFWYAREVIA